MADTVLPQSTTKPVLDTNADPIFLNADYTPVLSNWFTAKPYGFRFTPKDSEPSVMYLPIGPSNLTISTPFATNVIPTIYGTVEEHSPVRYFDIVIEGTTGMAPKYTQPAAPGSGVQSTGRTSFAIQAAFGKLNGSLTNGFFANTLKAATNVFNDTKSLIGQEPVPVTGLQLDQTGYIAFHNLYRFLLKYKKDVSGTDTKDGKVDGTPRKTNGKHPLVFFNYKDNNEYNVVIRSFTLRRDKENPMLYNYSIQMRGYDLKSIDNSDGVNSVANPSDLLKALGLDGVKGSTLLTDIKAKALAARGILSSVANGVNQLGR